MKFYGTFGIGHRHEINGKVFDKDTIIEMECDTNNESASMMQKKFGVKYCTTYSEQAFERVRHYFNAIVPYKETM